MVGRTDEVTNKIKTIENVNKINFLRCFEMKYKVKKNKINEKKDVLSPDKKITKHTSDTIKIYTKQLKLNLY